MNSNNSLSDTLDERINKLEETRAIAAKFRDGQLSFDLDESAVLKHVEEAVLEFVNYGWEIDSMLEDGKLSLREVDLITDYLDKMIDVTSKLINKHQKNVLVVNKVISVCQALKRLVSEIEYLTDIEYQETETTEIRTFSKETGYTIYESDYFEILEELKDILVDNITIKDRKISKLEREIINAIEFIGRIEENIVLNVLYLKPPILMNEILNSTEILRALLDPIHSLISGKYFQEEIKSAKIGVALISENKSLDIGDAVKIRDLFTKKRGAEDLSKLSDSLLTFDSDEEEFL